MKAQINIRLTNIASRDPPPQYPIQDIPLMMQLVLDLIHTVNSTMKERWNRNPRIKIFLADSHSDFERLQDDSDCVIQVNEESVCIRFSMNTTTSPGLTPIIPYKHYSAPTSTLPSLELATRPNRPPNAQSTIHNPQYHNVCPIPTYSCLLTPNNP
jgi:hypothetical protein